MAKRKVAWIAVFFLGVMAILGVVYGVYNVHDIKLSQEQIQEKINAKLPLVKGNFTVTNLNIYFLDDGRLYLIMDASGKQLGQKFDLSADALVKPIFNSQNGTFHFEPYAVKLFTLDIKGDSVAKKTEKFIDKWIDSKKIQVNKEEIGKKVEERVFSADVP